MKPRTLARIAQRLIDNGTFVFDCPERKEEALKQIKNLLSGKAETVELEDPIVEFHIGVYIPNFDYPLIPVDRNNAPIVWKESKNYIIPGDGTHMFRGVGLSGEYYYMGYLESLAPYRDAIIKVDRYTDVTRAAYTMLCTMSRQLNKAELLDHMITDYPIKVEYDVLRENWEKNTSDVNVKEFEAQQKKLYIKWLQKWIMTHGRNPDTHMKVLRNPKNKTPAKISLSTS
jgi:hypothetical protein